MMFLDERRGVVERLFVDVVGLLYLCCLTGVIGHLNVGLVHLC